MKYSVLLFLIFFCLLFSCEEDDSSIDVFYPGEQEFGWAIGNQSGHDWESSGYWQYHQNDSSLIGLNFKTYSKYGEPRESYSLNEIPLVLGTYNIKGPTGDLGDGFVGGHYFRLASDGDAVIGSLKVNDEKDGFVTIDEFNPATKTLIGHFEVFYISESGTRTIEITDGEFEVRLYE